MDLLATESVAKHVRSFVQVAINTGKREIVEIVGATMYLRNDVLNVQRRQRGIILMQMTILASVVSAFSNLCSNLCVDHRANW